MEGNTIMIKCPNDGSLLKVRYFEGIESKMVTCPCCGRKIPFTSFVRVQTKDQEATEYPKAEPQQSTPENLLIGCLEPIDGGEPYRLHVGTTVVGRRSPQSKADYQLPVDSKRMSREHLLIEVKKVEGKGFVHYLSLYKERVNPTYVGKVQIFAGDKVVLRSGDIIRLPDAAIRFVIPDDDGTQI